MAAYWRLSVLSPQTLPAFEDANPAIEGAQGPASEIPFSNCSSSSLEYLLIWMHNSCMRTVDMKLKKVSNMKWTETRHVAQRKIPGLENLRTTTSAGSNKRKWLKRHKRTMNSSSPEVPVGAMHASAQVCQVMSLHCYAVMLSCLKIQIPLQLCIFIESFKDLQL